MSDDVRYTRLWSKDYGYCNARLRGMRARLLDESFLNGLMAATSLHSAVGLLRQTQYAPDLEGVRNNGDCTAAGVDEALKGHMVRTLASVFGFLNDEASFLVGTLVARRDVMNAKTVLRGKHMLLPNEDIERSLLPAGRLTAAQLDELVVQPDAEAVLDTLVAWDLPYTCVMDEARREYRESGRLAGLELALDRRFAEWANARLARTGARGSLARRLLGAQIDVTNLMTVLHVQRSSFADVDAATLMLTGGAEIDSSMFHDMCRPCDIDTLLDRLKRTSYRRALDAAAVRFLAENTVSTFERALEGHVVRLAQSFRRDDPLGIGIVLSYLWAKENEVTNVRIITHCASLHMPEEQVRREVIHA